VCSCSYDDELFTLVKVVGIRDTLRFVSFYKVPSLSIWFVVRLLS
jgi:thiosulfate reductase cytochrome b subunit